MSGTLYLKADDGDGAAKMERSSNSGSWPFSSTPEVRFLFSWRNQRPMMADSTCYSSGKVVNMNETGGNSGIPACNSDIMEVEVKEEALEFSNGNTEGEAEERGGVTTPVTPMKKLEMKRPKKRRRISVTGRPTTIEELFKTGLLEGYPVFYNDGKKGILLRGIIKGARILCSCDLCKGTRAVTAREFEIHACQIYKGTSQYICLENGKSLCDVIKECMQVPLETLEETIQTVIGPVPVKKSFICENCKGSFVTTLAGKGGQLCHSCMISLRAEATQHSMNTRNGRNKRLKIVDSNLNPSGEDVNVDETEGNSGIHTCNNDVMRVEVMEESKIRQLKLSTLKPKMEPMEFPSGNSEAKLTEERGITMSVAPVKKLKMKMSKKKLSRKMLEKKKKMISGMGRPTSVMELFKTGLLEGLPVFYDGGKKGILLQGTIRGTGILCSCYLCKETRVVTVDQFEIHAYKKKRRARDYVCLENGNSLRNVVEECMKDFSKTLEEIIQGVTGTVPTQSINTENGRMVDSNHIPSGKVVNMDDAQGNSGIPSCNSDFMEEARKFKRSTMEFSNVNSESKVEKKGGVTMSVTPTKKLKMKPSKKRFSRKMSKKKIPVTGRTVTVTELFKTGLLEGLPVFYNGGKKGILLRGTIRGTGILCSCDLCMGTRVVLATQFERHACKIKRRASDYICLENGKSLCDVIKECMRNPSKTLEETIQNVIGTVPLKKSLTCQDCKNKSFLEPLCEACVTSFKSEATPALPTSTENGLVEFESSATNRYLEQWEKKATDEYILKCRMK